MSLKNNKLMLIYGFEKELEEKLAALVNDNDLPNYKVIEKDIISMKIEDILNNLSFKIEEDSNVQEKVILFNDFEDKELDKAIKLVRENLGKDIILAVVTPKSIKWTFKYLLEHLIEERNFYMSQNKK